MDLMDGAIEKLRLLLEEQKEIIANLRKENTRLKNEIAAISKRSQKEIIAAKAHAQRSRGKNPGRSAKSPPPARALPSKPMPTRGLPTGPTKSHAVKTSYVEIIYIDMHTKKGDK